MTPIGQSAGSPGLLGEAKTGDVFDEFFEAMQGEGPSTPKPAVNIADSGFDDFFDELAADNQKLVGTEEVPTIGSFDGATTPVKSKIPVLKYMPKVLPRKRKPPTQEMVLVEQPQEGEDGQPEKKPEEGISHKLLSVLEHIRPPKALAVKDEEAQRFVQSAIERMVEAARLDEESIEAHATAIHKIQMLPKVIAIMNKYAFAVHFVTFNGCNALAAWLKPLPNGQLPNDHLRTSLLNNMSRLPITKEALAACSRENSLGTLVAKLSRSPQETVANRKTASALVQSWVKQVLAKKTTIDTLALAEDTGPEPQLDRPAPETTESIEAWELQSAKRIRPSPPVVGGKEYVIKPIPRFQPVRRDKVATETNRGKLTQVLNFLSRPSKAAWKPASVSIAGRTMNPPA